jgi:hypothetical protein
MPSWETWLGLALGLLLHLSAASPRLRGLWGRIPIGVKAGAYAVALALILLYAPPQETFIYAQF